MWRHELYKILDAIFAQTSPHELLTSSQFHPDQQSKIDVKINEVENSQNYELDCK